MSQAPAGGGAGDLDEADLRDPLVQDPPRSMSWLLLLGGLLGLAGALALTIEKVKVLEDPSYTPSCSINPVVSCGSVMTSDQAAAFGFPNSLLGIAAFTVVVTLGVLSLARVRLPGWVWGGLAVGSALGAVFVQWLAFQSLYRIGALCPYCMVVWSVTMPIFVTSSLYAARRNVDALPESVAPVVLTTWSWRSLLVVAWFTTVVVLVLERFWSYWSTLV